MNRQNCLSSPAAIALALSLRFEKDGVSQSDIAKAVGIHQSQVCRILSGRFKRCSKNVIKLCKYANINLLQDEVNPRDNERLMEALSFAWDGTEPHAEAIAQVLRAIGDLQKTRRLGKTI